MVCGAVQAPPAGRSTASTELPAAQTTAASPCEFITKIRFEMGFTPRGIRFFAGFQPEAGGRSAVNTPPLSSLHTAVATPAAVVRTTGQSHGDSVPRIAEKTTVAAPQLPPVGSELDLIC